MNAVKKMNFTSARIQTFPLSGVAMLATHVGHVDALVYVRSSPHVTHWRTDAMFADYSKDAPR